MDFVATTWPTGTCGSTARASTTSIRDDNRAAFATLHEVLVVVTPAAGAVRAVRHRLDASRADGNLRAPRALRRSLGTHEGSDETLERGDEPGPHAGELGRAAREEVEIKVRQPLSRMVCVAPDVRAGELADLLPLLAAELNVKTVEFATAAARW